MKIFNLALAASAIALATPATAAHFVTFTVHARGTQTTFTPSTPPGGGTMSAVNLLYSITVDIDPTAPGAMSGGTMYSSDGSHFFASYLGTTESATFNGLTLLAATYQYSGIGATGSWDLTRAMQGSTTGYGYRVDNITIDSIATADSATLPLFSLAISDALPEPAAWLTMIVGFGIIGVAIRHRKALPLQRSL